MIYRQGIYGVAGKYVAYLGNWEKSNIPGGWIWDDMGNYYGAGSGALNWHENQYDLVLASGNTVGDSVKIIETRPNLIQTNLVAELTSAAKGSGDNAYIYLAPMSDKGFVRGTIPLAEQAFVISGSFPDPAMQLLGTLQALVENGLPHPPKYQYNYDKKPAAFETIGTIRSPTLDSLNYWFMKKSINLYGETFVKTMGLEKSGFGATETGLRVLKNFWKERGIEPASLHMIDGSGLSPQNRVSTDALIRVLQYARSRPWFNYYYDALPVYNKMKLKSGTIGGAKSFAGYHTAKDGTEYSLAIIVNNFDGSAAEMVKKMFLVLDELK
jgi:D-alanyl-D-alanine carboxypeptidase/D-alanyl-D-alanine-endopeptidase (penicillin-binding protein 4)